MKIIATALLTLALTGIAPAGWGASAADRTQARQRLHQQQLESDLALRMQQDTARARAGASLKDRFELDALARRQRMEQQALQQEQSVNAHRFADDPRAFRQQERMYAQERDAQLQRFQLERERLLGPTSPPPLQPAPRPGELALP